VGKIPSREEQEKVTTVSGESPDPVKITLDLRDRILDFSDEELLSRLENFEDNFVERKRIGDSKDEWLQAAVAFANSVPIGYPAILFIGVKNTGEIEGGANLDTLRQTLSKVIDEAYPAIYYTTRINDIT
jgi:predicted HTH transcriptional regulator